MATARRMLAVIGALVLGGCSVVSQAGRLSDRPSDSGFFLSTGGAPRPFKTLGFAQILGYGATLSGITELGKATFDATIHQALTAEARRLGGDGVINIEFVDENPQTPMDRVQELSRSIQNQRVESTNRTVVITGEIIKFL
jgi:hypothetical protein